MAEKDMTEKTLEAYNDVFADIVNVLLFKGKKLINEEDLVTESPHSIYKANGRLHEQERDVAKYWLNGTIRIALMGFENQTEADADMSLRVLSYDGAAYRAQLLTDKNSEDSNVRYPVVTLVLYFGYKHRWNKAKSLLERISIPESLKPFVNDYRINIFEVAWLDDEVVSKFQSDFRLVADYFVQMRKNKQYEPPEETIKHVHEFLQLMSVMTGDSRYEDVYRTSGKELNNMCKVLDAVESKGLEQGILQGITQGKDAERISSIRNVMSSLKVSAMRAMEILCIPDNERKKYLALIEG
ncbi:MAG: Rpn family recombination-promoting nuclease/putative transposase [Selenomonas sp.]|nr:Rpn family recombination-promoting nuclease/putative transposase [Selenomonas sp.]